MRIGQLLNDFPGILCGCELYKGEPAMRAVHLLGQADRLRVHEGGQQRGEVAPRAFEG